MAFVVRSDRRIEWESKTTLGQCGPGAYNLRDADPQRLDFSLHLAPFGSTKIRDASQPVMKSSRPGPGNYGTNDAVHRINWARDDVVGLARSAFRSHTDRLYEDWSSYVADPGPGAYEVQPKWGKQGASRLTSASSRGHAPGTAPAASGGSPLRFERQPNCPSVPDRFRSYGYDEGPDGKLVPQRPSNIRTVVGIDRPGPTDYDPNPALMRRGESATEFGKRSRKDRQLFATSSNPGPGAYHSDATKPRAAPLRDTVPRVQGWRGPRETAVGTGNFVSGSQRFPDARDGPGPGEYGSESGGGDTQPRAPRPAFSTTDRLAYQKDVYTMRNAPTYTKNPGPGAYESRGLRPKKVSAGFRSTSPRFARERARSPGPGAYRAEAVASTERAVQQMLASKTGVSGTSNPRFTSHDRPVSATPASPGPAVYQADVPQIVKRHKERGKMSSSFSTQVDRFRTRDGTVYIRDDVTGEEVEYRKPVPGPGAYNAPDAFSRARSRQGRGRSDDGFLVSSQRLPANAGLDGTRLLGSDVHPGPGEYEAGLRERGKGMAWRPGRRFPTATTAQPGPGNYNLRSDADMVTKTYNVTYGAMARGAGSAGMTTGSRGTAAGAIGADL